MRPEASACGSKGVDQGDLVSYTEGGLQMENSSHLSGEGSA